MSEAPRAKRKAKKFKGNPLAHAALRRISQFTLPSTADVDDPPVFHYRPVSTRRLLEVVEVADDQELTEPESLKRLAGLLAEALCDEDGNTYATADDVLELSGAVILEMVNTMAEVRRMSLGGAEGNG